MTKVLDDDPANPLASAPLWRLGESFDPSLLDELGGPPFELSQAFQRLVDAGETVHGVEIGPTRDLTHPLDCLEQNFTVSEGTVSEVYDYFQQGRRHLKKGMAAQATVPLEKAKRREPNKASIRESLGIAYFRIGRYDEAAAEFRAMLELSPADDYAHYALGRCLEKQGHAAEANGHYKLARSLRPGSKQYAARVMELDDSDRGLTPESGRSGSTLPGRALRR